MNENDMESLQERTKFNLAGVAAEHTSGLGRDARQIRQFGSFDKKEKT
jgi:hypothetical protein